MCHHQNVHVHTGSIIGTRPYPFHWYCTLQYFQEGAVYSLFWLQDSSEQAQGQLEYEPAARWPHTGEAQCCQTSDIWWTEGQVLCKWSKIIIILSSQSQSRGKTFQFSWHWIQRAWVQGKRTPESFMLDVCHPLPCCDWLSKYTSFN